MKTTTDFLQVAVERADKTAGVEIEFFGADRDTVARKLKEAGIKLKVEGWTNQKNFGDKAWKLTTDGSVTRTGTGVGRGLELVSPPLTVAELQVQLKVVADVLNACGAKTDRTCGLHVHHHIDDLSLEHIKNVYRIYQKHNQSIDEFMPESRRAINAPTYCKGLSYMDMEKVEQAQSIADLYRTERYRTINFQSYVKYGTIEFRQHSGTTDFDKIFNWVLITQMIVATAKKKKAIKPLAPSANVTMAFNKEIGIYNTAQGVWFRDRKKALNKKANRVAVAS